MTTLPADPAALRFRRQRRELLTGVSHHLRTPLASMHGYLELLLLRHDALAAAERRNYVETALRQCERLTRLVGGMAQLAELDADDATAPEDFPLAELAHDVAQKLGAEGARRGVALVVQAGGQDGVAHADIGLVERALVQLASRALHRAPPGGRVTILCGRGADGRLRLAVGDGSLGAPGLRTPFGGRADADDLGDAEGAAQGGLGLAIVQRIAELHGGTLDTSEVPGAGTTIGFGLPAAGQAPATATGGDAGSEADPLLRLERECSTLRAALDRSDAARAAAEADLRAVEQRYMLALRGSQDGLWEWDVGSGRVQLSPRWKSMLGFASHEVGDERASWLAHVHADDRGALEAALGAALADDAGGQIDLELRLLHKDGSVRHVLSRGVAVRDARGAACRVVGLDTDVTALRRLQTVLDALAEGTASAHGDAFFPALVRNFARALGVEQAFVAQCVDEPPTRVRTLARWNAKEGLIANIEFALAGTPCEAVVQDGRSCFHASDLEALFPRERGFEAYLGMPIVGSDGRVLGHLAFFDTRPRGADLQAEPVYRIFLARAAAELERRQAERRRGAGDRAQA